MCVFLAPADFAVNSNSAIMIGRIVINASFTSPVTKNSGTNSTHTVNNKDHSSPLTLALGD